MSFHVSWIHLLSFSFLLVILHVCLFLAAGTGAGSFIFFFPLHAPVLEPDFDLSLRETQSMGDLNASPPRQVAVVMKLLLQFQGLIPGVGLPAAFSIRSWEGNTDWDQLDSEMWRGEGGEEGGIFWCPSPSAPQNEGHSLTLLISSSSIPTLCSFPTSPSLFSASKRRQFNNRPSPRRGER